jgi:hypothetical protein
MSGSDRLRGKSLKDSGLLIDSETGYRVDADGQILKVCGGSAWDEPTGYYLNEKGELVKHGMIFDNPTGLKLDDRGGIVRTGQLWDSSSGLHVDDQGTLSEKGQIFDRRVDWREGLDRLTAKSEDRSADGMHDETYSGGSGEESTAPDSVPWSPKYVPPVYESLSRRLVLPVSVSILALVGRIAFPDIGGADTWLVLLLGPLFSYGVPVIFVWAEFVCSFNSETNRSGLHEKATGYEFLGYSGIQMLVGCLGIYLCRSLTDPSNGSVGFLAHVGAFILSLFSLIFYWGGLLWGLFLLIGDLSDFVKGMRRMMFEWRSRG